MVPGGEGSPERLRIPAHSVVALVGDSGDGVGFFLPLLSLSRIPRIPFPRVDLPVALSVRGPLCPDHDLFFGPPPLDFPQGQPAALSGPQSRRSRCRLTYLWNFPF